MLGFTRILLFSLAVFGDALRILPQNKRQAGRFWTDDQSLLDKMFGRGSYTVGLWRLLQTQRIEKVVEKGRVKIRITPKGLKFLSQHLDLSKFSRKKWDGKWRMVVFDVSEKDKKSRNKLRQEIRDLGFGMLQESVWICPFPLEDKLKEYFSTWKLRGEILVSKSEVLVGDQKDIAWRVWHLSRLSKSYRRLIEWWQSLPQKGRNKSTALSFQQKYFSLLFSDPFLPAELLPKDWPGSKSGFLFTQQVSKLLNR